MKFSFAFWRMYSQAESECEARLSEALEYSDPVSESSFAAQLGASPPPQAQSPRAVAHSAHLRASHALFDRLRAVWYSSRAANLHYRLASLLYKSLMAHHSEVGVLHIFFFLCEHSLLG